MQVQSVSYFTQGVDHWWLDRFDRAGAGHRAGHPSNNRHGKDEQGSGQPMTSSWQ